MVSSESISSVCLIHLVSREFYDQQPILLDELVADNHDMDVMVVEGMRMDSRAWLVVALADTLLDNFVDSVAEISPPEKDHH